MSDFEKIAVGKEVESFEVSPQFDAYSGVVIVDSEGNEELVGTDTGRTITIPGITRAQAQAILADLTGSGFQYQPYTASNAILNPAAELGDGVTINGTYSGIYKMSRNYSPLMTADIEAPQDEEIDHEYPYEPKQDRIYKREIAQAMTRISQTEDAITLEAQRATSAEGTLSSRITQNASAISAKVSQTGGNNSSFGWSLTSSSFDLYSGGSRVFRATSSGVEISGRITATSGYIGTSSRGFTISASSLYNGTSYLWDGTNQGVYIGTDGINIGAGSFIATSGGYVRANNIEANNAVLTGTLTIGGQNITAAALRSGAQSAYNNSGTWNGTTNTVNSNGSYWSTGAGYGYTSNKVFNNNQQVSYMNTRQLTANSFQLGSLWVYWTWIKDQNGISRHVLASANNGQS